MTSLFDDSPEIASLRATCDTANEAVANTGFALRTAQSATSADNGNPIGRAISAEIAAGNTARVEELRGQQAAYVRDLAELPHTVEILTRKHAAADMALARAEIAPLTDVLIARRDNVVSAVEALRVAVREFIAGRKAYDGVYSRASIGDTTDKANPLRGSNVAGLPSLVTELVLKLRDYQ